MSRTMKIFTALLAITTVLSGWLWLHDRTPSQPQATEPSSTESATTATSVPSAVLLDPSPSTTPTVDENIVVTPAAGAPTEASARDVAASFVQLDERRMRSVETATAMTNAIAATGSRDVLVVQAVRQTNRLHTELGADLTMWAQPLRARTISLNASAAVIDVWWVKLVTSPGMLTAGDIWGTTRFSLVWQNDTWRLANEESHLGPWPTHASDAVHHPSGAAFTAELTGFTPIEPAPLETTPTGTTPVGAKP